MRGRAPSRRELVALKEAATDALVKRTLADTKDPEGDAPFTATADEAAEAEQAFHVLCTPELVLRLLGTLEGRLR